MAFDAYSQPGPPQHGSPIGSKIAAALASLSAIALLGACGPGNIIAKNKSIADVDDQTTTCKVAKDPLNPMIVEWPATSKVNLDRASKGGLVVVSYAGCTLKVLQGCTAKGSYAYTGVTPARDKIDIASQDDLFARLPLGAISLKGELEQGGGLRLDYIAVGQRVASDAPTKLEGDCEGATHYVRTITLGAYALNRTAKARAGGGVEVNGAGAGLERKEADMRINSSGDVDKCGGTSPSSEEAAESSGCGAPLQLDLAPLQIAGSGGGVVSGGFGQGLGGLSTGPSELTGVDSVGASSLKDVDPDYLLLLQNAKRADRDKAMKPIDKSNAWGALADYKGTNPTKKLAEERRDAWEKQAADLEKLKQQYLADKAKLDKILALDDETVPKDSKKAYKKEFAEVYKPWTPQLELAMGQPVAASDAEGGASTGENKLGSFRVDVEGGYDAQKLSYGAKDASGAPIFLRSNDPNADGSYMTGDAGGSGGFIGAILTLPQIPAPGFGLSAIVRYALGADVSRILAGAGMRFSFVKPTTSSGVAIGLWASYVKLLTVKDNAAASASCSSSVTSGSSGPSSSFKGCRGQYQALVDGSSGGADFRVALLYDLAIGDYISLTFGGTLNYTIIPYSIPGSTTQAGKPVDTSDLAQGIGATLNAGLGAHF